ncbi:hypothetical protein [Calothrix sp. 336/3]|uniref:hypothetical protein n=1 Tax=Calothrix sp. 336/3 TaxID=1337936 RepID=UPI0004E32522|nr:hypothetical protein [Calothrix sp. 336/3]AKG20411.1 hypothetical protein IJ00_02915 [Calothrix sp. 336/3]
MINSAYVVTVLPYLVGLTLGIVYRKPISYFLTRLNRAKLSSSGVELETHKQLGKLSSQGQEMASILKEIRNDIERIVHHEKPYTDYVEVLQDTEKYIRECCEEEKSHSTSHINIKIMAVSMNFSWNFIAGKVPKILKDYDNAYINTEIVFVDADFLELLQLETYNINWAAESRQRVMQIKNFIHGLPDNLRDRFSVSARVYRNIPHWHGFLVNRKYLFLGRTDWDFSANRPKLSVGQNKYLYFDRSAVAGCERIDLFSTWHRYYFEFASKSIHDIN